MQRGSAEGSSLRLFVAILLPEAVKDELAKAQAEMHRSLSSASVRWAQREQFHLTLKFLGEVEADLVDSLTKALEGACQPFGQLHLHAQRIGFFPNDRRPRVVWVGIEDQNHNLSKLQQAVDAALREFSSEDPETRGTPLGRPAADRGARHGGLRRARPPSAHEFSGHITLGRIRDARPAEAEALASLAGRMADRSFGHWAADRIHLMRSELLPSGARHSALASVQLPAP
jgi:RNA 2',3'-cyclic 3'-phosphodiesterase